MYYRPKFNDKAAGATWELLSHVPATEEAPVSVTTHRLTLPEGALYEVKEQRWFDEGTAQFLASRNGFGAEVALATFGANPVRWAESGAPCSTIHFERGGL